MVFRRTTMEIPRRLVDVVSLRAETDAGEPNPVVWVDDDNETVKERFSVENYPKYGWYDTYDWDGRDQSERVVSPGTYTMYIHGLDGAGNEGLRLRDIVLANYLGGMMSKGLRIRAPESFGVAGHAVCSPDA